MAVHGVKKRDDGRYVLKMDTRYRGARMARAAQAGVEELEAREKKNVDAMWGALEELPCPTLVVRGAASDLMSPEVADRMVDEVIPDAKLAVVAQAGHSVMTDNPTGFKEAVGAFVLG